MNIIAVTPEEIPKQQIRGFSKALELFSTADTEGRLREEMVCFSADQMMASKAASEEESMHVAEQTVVHDIEILRQQVMIILMVVFGCMVDEHGGYIKPLSFTGSVPINTLNFYCVRSLNGKVSAAQFVHELP